jgi:hypothetical protein
MGSHQDHGRRVHLDAGSAASQDRGRPALRDARAAASGAWSTRRAGALRRQALRR